MKGCIWLLAVALALNELAITAGAAPMYHLIDLGTLGGTLSSAYGINASGQVVGESTTGKGTDAFLYSGGQMHDLGTLGTADDSHATAINSAGQVVGYSYVEDGHGGGVAHVFLYSNGVMQDLGTLAGRSAYAYGINSNGSIAGYGASTTGDDAFVYSNGHLNDLGAFGATYAFAYGINSSGQLIANTSTSGSPVVRSLLYSPSTDTTTDLGTLDGNYTQAHAINDIGQVVGDDGARAFLYSDGTMTDLGTLVGSDSSADGINSSGEVVGYSIITGNFQHAFLYTGGRMLDLNTLVDNPLSGWTITHALGINDSGWICGNITNGQNDTHAVLLTPVPEPAALGLVVYAGWLCRGARGQIRGRSVHHAA